MAENLTIHDQLVILEDASRSLDDIIFHLRRIEGLDGVATVLAAIDNEFIQTKISALCEETAIDSFAAHAIEMREGAALEGESSDTEITCARCGGEIRDQRVEESGPAYMFCETCAADLFGDDTAECEQCGAALTASDVGADEEFGVDTMGEALCRKCCKDLADDQIGEGFVTKCVDCGAPAMEAGASAGVLCQDCDLKAEAPFLR